MAGQCREALTPKKHVTKTWLRGWGQPGLPRCDRHPFLTSQSMIPYYSFIFPNERVSCEQDSRVHTDEPAGRLEPSAASSATMADERASDWQAPSCGVGWWRVSPERGTALAGDCFSGGGASTSTSEQRWSLRLERACSKSVIVQEECLRKAGMPRG